MSLHIHVVYLVQDNGKLIKLYIIIWVSVTEMGVGKGKFRNTTIPTYHVLPFRYSQKSDKINQQLNKPREY